MTSKPRLRFAPSPTGYLHVGGARTALFNWLEARRRGGTFVLRMEDTDAERNTPEARASIFAGLRWLGLEPDEGPEQGGAHGPYSQSERGALYAETIEELKRGGAVYPCFCTRERLGALREKQKAEKQNLRYDGLCRGLGEEEARARLDAGEPATWRLRVPEGETVLEDVIRGRITVPNQDIEDIILVRGDGTPVYNLAVVVDDHRMAITDVVRGEDHLTNTFKQVLLFDVLGWERPRFAHLPLILGGKGEGKLSKRKHPEAALEHYIEKGYPVEAFVNWLALLGWAYDGETETMSRQELIERFSLERVNKAGARLNLDKLAAMAGERIRAMPDGELGKAIEGPLVAAGLCTAGEDPGRLEHLARVARERLTCFSDAATDFAWVFRPFEEYEPKAEKNLRKNDQIPALLRDYAASLPDPLPDADALEQRARDFVGERGAGFGALVHPVRAAVTGKAGGPPLFDCLVLVGRAEVVRRLEAAAAFAEGSA